MALESDDDDDDDEEDDDGDDENKSDSDMDEEDTVQANIDEMDKFRLPGAEESEKEGELLIVIYYNIPVKASNLTVPQTLNHFLICIYRCLAARLEDNPSKNKGQH